MEVDLNARNKCHILKNSNRGKGEKSGVIYRCMYVEGRFIFYLRDFWNFPGGPEVKNLPEVKNPPVNSEDTVSIPGPRRSHMPRNNSAHAP